MCCDENNIMKNVDEYVIAWRCWYDNWINIDEYNSVEHCWEQLPDDGFQAMRIWYADGTGRHISGNDYYFLSEHPAGLIVGQSNDLDIKERYPKAIIKRGRHCPDIMMKQINELMSQSTNPLHGN